MGAKKRPSYRIVVADSKSPRDGRFIEIVGFYDPLTDPATVRVNEERAQHWLSVGAQPTDTVRHILGRVGIGGAKKTTAATADAAPEPVVEEEAAAPAKPAPRRRKKAADAPPVEPAPAPAGA